MDTSREQRYGPVRAAWVAMYRPVRAVRRADHLGAIAAWAVHAAGIVMVLGVLMVLAVWDLNGGKLNPAGLIERAGQIVGVVGEITGDPRLWAVLIGFVLITEFTWALSAAVVMSWCAREEPYRVSYLRALRRLWLLTPHLIGIVVVLGAWFVWLHNSDRWRLGVFNGLNTEGAAIWMLIFAPVCLWALRVVLTALSVNPPAAVSRWPLRCEGCGYELAGLDRGGDCPECGLAIVKTLSRESRPGIAPAGGFGWYLSQTFQAIRRPTAFGRRMHVMSQDTGYRTCLAMTLMIQVLLTPIAWLGLTLLLGAMQDTSWRFMRHVVTGMMILSIAVSLVILATTAGVCLLMAGVAGVTEGRHHKRNLMPAAARAVGYLSGFAVVWAAVVWCNVGLTLVAWEYQLIPLLAAQMNIVEEKLVGYWHYGVALVGVLIFGVLVERVTKAARYANW